ncbi:hypothetical protein FQR65_LT09374 [Abscondita terminalis]|nr:hypothetical protein FQR65_LT09374 [Abscondita terminalis]
MYCLLFFVFALPTILSTPTPQPPTVAQMFEAWRVLVNPLESKCACASGAKVNDIKTLWKTFQYPPNNACLRCYLKCIYYELGFVDYQGNLIEENIVRDALGVTPIIAATCKNETANILDLCDKFYQLDKCLTRLVQV